MTKAGAARGRTPRAEADGSSGRGDRQRLRGGAGARSLDVLALALAAGLAIVAADFLVVFSVDVGATSCEAVASPDLADACAPTGGERHSYAFVLLGLFTLAMAWGASAGRSRPAGAALLLAGAVVLAVTLIGDLPDAFSEGLVGPAYADAQAAPGPGLWVALAGGALAVAAGLLRLSRPS